MNIDHCSNLTSLGNYLEEQASRPDLKQYDSYPPLPDETVSVFAAYFKTLLADL